MKLRGRSLIVSVVLMLTLSVPSHGADDVTLHIAGRQTPINMTAGSILTFSPNGLLVTQQNNVVDQASYGTVTLGPKRDAVHIESDGQGQGNSSGNPINVIVELPTVVINYPDPVILGNVTKDLSQAEIIVAGQYVYTGQSIVPEYTVKYDGVVLTKGIDYHSTILNNVNVGTNSGCIKIEGTGDTYVGTKIAYFTIDPVVLTVKGDTITKIYGDSLPKFTYKLTGFVNNENLNVLEKLPEAKTDATVLSNVGSYVVSFENASAKNYTFEYQSGLLIVEPRSLANAEVTIIEDSCVFTGMPIAPSCIVKLDTLTLKENVDYRLNYSNNTNPGTAIVAVEGLNNYTDTAYTSFVIYQPYKISVSIDSVEVEPDFFGNGYRALYTKDGHMVRIDGYNCIVGDTVTLGVFPKQFYLSEVTLSEPSDSVLSDDNVIFYKFAKPAGDVLIDIKFKVDSVVLDIQDLEELEISYSIYNTRGQMVERGKALGHQDVLDRVKHQPQGLYIIKLNNKTFKVYRK